MIYRYERRGRRGSTLFKLAIVWGIIAFCLLYLDMVWWIAALVLAITLPAIIDYIKDKRIWIEVWPNRLVWQASLSGGESGTIDHIRLNRRFDGTMKVILVHVGGATTRLPPDLAPPSEPFEAALQTAGFSVQKHPFSII